VSNLNQEQLRRLARLGAVARLEQIRAEEQAIRAEFPELFGGARGAQRGRPGRRPGAAQASEGTARSAGAGARKGGRRRKRMSPDARKAVSERMRKYWADRRKAKAGK